jgi:hypothetical protein
MQRGRIEIGSSRPDHRVHLGVEPDLRKDRRVAQRSVEFARQNRLKINRAYLSVGECQPQRVMCNQLNRGDPMDGVVNTVGLLQRRYRCRAASFLEKLPVSLQFELMQFGPSLDQALLAQWKGAGDLCDR